MPGKLYIKTFGCQMNEYDSARLADLLYESHGLERTSQAEQADVLLLNTCSVRERAQEKVFSQLGRWREWKDERPQLVIGVGGCVASQEGEAIVRRAPYVDIVFGPQTLHRLPLLYDKTVASRRPAVDVSFPEIEKFDCLPPPRVTGARAYVSVMEGCSKYCSFCVVPYTRGEEFSRPFDDVLTELADLAQQDVREVTLLGQNVNAYRGALYRGGEVDFAQLLHYVSEIDGIERIRYTTSHPLEFTDDLIQAYADLPKLVSHLHLPVQSGSDRILALMKRRYTVAHYKDIITRLRTLRPQLSVSSDFIVGFPGETEADFQDTMDLIEDIDFDQSFSFVFSSRPGTPAAELDDDIPLEVKQERLCRLQTRINRTASQISRRMVGSVQRVLAEGPAKRGTSQLCGRSDNNRVVNFPGSPEAVDEFIDVEITEALPNSLRGRPIHAAGQLQVSYT